MASDAVAVVGAHIFHTSNPQVAAYVQRYGLSRPYEHRVLTEAYLPDGEEPWCR